MGETLIIRNSAGFHLQAILVYSKAVIMPFAIFMLFLRKLFQKLLVEILLIFINLDVIYMFQRNQSDAVTIVSEI